MTELSVTELEPCPFCGGGPFEYDMMDEYGGKIVECEKCACRTSIHEDRGAARETWNTRAMKAAEQPATPGDGMLREAAQALIDDVRRRYPGEELRCEYMRALDAALEGTNP